MDGLTIHTSSEEERLKVIEKIVSLLERMTVSYEWREKKKPSEEDERCQNCGKPSVVSSSHCEECIRLNIGEVYYGD
tara:strand:- start:203 stop:433 length:231 start_codon:yes stop_codon:yes gene_type:complete